MLTRLRIENSPFNEQQIEQLQNSIGSLTPLQSQWLSGYLAGCLADPSQLSDQPQSVADTGEVLNVIYATETGHSEGVANGLIEDLKNQGFNTELHSLDSFRPAALRKLKNVAFIISTHGEGDPPDEALSFFEYLESDRAPQLPELNYRVLALGDRSYQKFCEAGRWLDQRLQQLGATAFGERLETDVDFSKEAKVYRGEVAGYVREHLSKPVQGAGNEAATAHHLSLVTNEVQWSQDHPYDAELGQIQRITAEDSSKDVYHIELLLDDSNLNYQPGDSLGIWASNDPQVVIQILETLDIDAFEQVQFDGQQLNIAQALTDHLEITRLTSETVISYAEIASQPKLESSFSSLSNARQQSFIEQRQLIDLVEDYPGKVDAQQLVNNLRVLAPRSYSIASSQKTVDEEVHLTVATLHSNANGNARHGVASGLLNHRMKAGEKIRVFPEPNRRFRLPENSQTPIIMIAAGTGVAPYRAFMQELENQDDKPDSWLIFGNPHLRTDFLYQREWLRWRETGLLNQIDTAWSRDQKEKRYVQDVVLEQAETINQWLQRGAVVYLCGSLQMGKAVQQALLTVLAQQNNLEADEAASAFAELRRDGRIKKDLY